MFGIGLPEMLVILAVALIVVGPDKLPELARSLAKGVLELRKTAESVKSDLIDENPLADLKANSPDLAGLKASLPELPKLPDLHGAARRFQEEILEVKPEVVETPPEQSALNTPVETAAEAEMAATADAEKPQSPPEEPSVRP
ncbi:MAG: twin-arginine translocase TatA/TatE family subunit [Desulfobulbaceae bacterium]|nr:twin-arginine translocase TatA/TatE family subunit [Desulfobulbaceae bacterium]